MVKQGVIVQVVEFPETRAIEVLDEGSFQREWFEISKCRVGKLVHPGCSFELRSQWGVVQLPGKLVQRLDSCVYSQCPSEEFKGGRWVGRKVLVN